MKSISSSSKTLVSYQGIASAIPQVARDQSPLQGLRAESDFFGKVLLSHST